MTWDELAGYRSFRYTVYALAGIVWAIATAYNALVDAWYAIGASIDRRCADFSDLIASIELTHQVYPCQDQCHSPCCHYGCEMVAGHRWKDPAVSAVTDSEGFASFDLYPGTLLARNQAPLVTPGFIADECGVGYMEVKAYPEIIYGAPDDTRPFWKRWFGKPQPMPERPAWPEFKPVWREVDPQEHDQAMAEREPTNFEVWIADPNAYPTQESVTSCPHFGRCAIAGCNQDCLK